MRRAATLLSIVLAFTACDSGQEIAPTPPVETATTTTTMPITSTSTTQATTTTIAPSTTTTTLDPLEGLAYEEVADFDFPIQVVPWDEAALVASKDGQIWVLTDGELGERPILDIADQVRNDGEQGFLSIAVHPEDSSRVFAHYSDNDGDTVVSEFSWDGESLGDEQVIFTHDQPAGNHNGGMLQFGPDGALHLGLGDGGGADDRFGNGQNLDTLLAGLVRIDVDERSDPVKWQMGLRNPWRFWFDGDLVYIADVGQNAFEEVNVAAPEEGINYGWPITEGLHCFSPSSGCDTSGLTLPVIEVGHGDAGTCSITGGVVYRGAAIPEIAGQFFYSDFCGGYLRSFAFENGEVTEETDWTDQVGVPGGVVSFGVDEKGEMYVLTTDRILKVVPERAG